MSGSINEILHKLNILSQFKNNSNLMYYPFIILGISMTDIS